MSMRALIIEDDASVGAAVQWMLGREGWETVHVGDAVSGMEAFKLSNFDLVIIDIFMPGMNGLKAIAGFRDRALTVPILAVSGFRFRGSMEPGLDFLGMAAKAGASVCLRKPFTPEQFISAVRASLDSALSSVQA
jgi:DNA-binding response OmpR family regulator